MNHQILADFNNKIDYIIIGHNATSYKLPLIVDYVKEYEDKICIECRNIKGKYIVFDKTTFLNAIQEYNNNNKENNNDNNKEKT